MGCAHSKPLPQLYYDSKGVLHKYDGSIHNTPKEETFFVSAHDSTILNASDECYVIAVSWLEAWIKYSSCETSQLPGPIRNDALIDPENKEKMRRDAKIKKEFRPVCKDVWNYFFERYGGGPVICFLVPFGLQDASYKSGDWIKKTKIHELAHIVYPHVTSSEAQLHASLPTMMIQSNISRLSDISIGQATADAAAYTMLQGVGKDKIRQAKALDADISAAGADAVGNLWAKDLAKQKMAQAAALSEDINSETTGMVANMFAQEKSASMVKEAQRMQAESTAAAAGGIANMFADDAAKKQLEEARKKEAEATALAAGAIATQLAQQQEQERMKREREDNERLMKEQQERKIMESFKNMGAKMRFRAARNNTSSSPETHAILVEAAAEMLQGAWRARVAYKKHLQLQAERREMLLLSSARRVQNAYRRRLARKKIEQKRREKREMMLNACARRLQSKYRTRLARRKVQQLKAERQRLLEEAYAIKLQSAWRIRAARKKIAAMKEQRHQLQLEGAARMFQCAFRCRQARNKVIALKKKKQELLEQGAALMLQSAWRIKQARAKVSGLREKKQQNECSAAIQRLWATKLARRKFLHTRTLVTRISAYMRGVLARRKYAAMIATEMIPLVVKLQYANDINVGDTATSDAYVIITATSPVASTSTYDAPTTTLTTVSYSKSSVKRMTLNPVWNEVLTAAAPRSSKLVLTMLDSDVVGQDDFLGQNVLDLHKDAAIRVGKQQTLSFTALPIGDYCVPVHDAAGKALVTSGTDTPGKGTIALSVKVGHRGNSCSGWLWKVSSSTFSSAWKLRFFTLIDNTFTYYENEHTLHTIKGSLNCSEVTGVADDKYKGADCFVLSGGKEKWIMKFRDEESADMRRRWMRVIIRNCAFVTDPELAKLGKKKVVKEGIPLRRGSTFGR